MGTSVPPPFTKRSLIVLNNVIDFLLMISEYTKSKGSNNGNRTCVTFINSFGEFRRECCGTHSTILMDT